MQSIHTSTDSKAKCEMILNQARVEHVVRQYLCCKNIETGQPLYLHRFIEETDLQENGRGNDTQWTGRIKMLTNRMEKLNQGIVE